MITIITQRENA